MLQALRNAIINLGKIPKVTYQDNGKAFKGKFFRGSKNLDECGFHGLFGKLGIIPVFAQPYNAKAKTVERFWKEFTSTFESMLPSYVGNNIANKPAYMKRNEKFHKEIHSQFVPTIEQAKLLIDKWMEFHNAQPCPHCPDKKIGEVFNEGKGQGVDIDLLDDLMMAEETRGIRRNGVKFLHSNYFANEMFGIKDKVLIKYSLFDLSYIKVYGTDGSYICKAEKVKQHHPMEVISGNNDDMSSYKHQLKANKKIARSTEIKAKGLIAGLKREVTDWQKSSIEELPIKKIAAKTKEKEVMSEEIYQEISNYSLLERKESESLPEYWELTDYKEAQGA